MAFWRMEPKGHGFFVSASIARVGLAAQIIEELVSWTSRACEGDCVSS